MYLKKFKRVNANRFTKKLNLFNSNFFSTVNIFKNRKLNSSFFFKYKKLTKFYKKKFMFYSSKILKPINFTNLIINSSYSIISVKKLGYSSTMIGLCELKLHDNDLSKYLLHKNLNYLSIFNKYFNKVKLSGSLFFIKLFHGYKLENDIYNVNTNFFNHESTQLIAGSISFLKCFHIGGTVYTLTDKKNKIVYSSAPGTYSTILDHNDYDNITFIQLPSGLVKKFNSYSWCILGRCCNIFHKFVVLGKAGNKFHLKKKNVTVRGVAMNPVDHPNGGRSKVKKPFRSVWGWTAKNNK